MATYSNSAREVEMPNGDVVILHSAPTGGANTTSNIKKFKYDDNGHVTESDAANATDLNLSSYSTPTTGSTAIGTSDAVQTAIGKLDHQSQIDQTNILSVENNSYKTNNLTDNIVRLVENKEGYAYITSTAGDVIKSVGKNLLNPQEYAAVTGGSHFTVTTNTDGSCTIVSDGAEWTNNGYVSGKIKIPVSKPGTFYFVCEHISGNVYRGNAPTTPAVLGHQSLFFTSSGEPASSTSYSSISLLADAGSSVLRTIDVTSEILQAGAAYLQVAIWSNGTSNSTIFDNYRYRVACYWDDATVTDTTAYQSYKESTEICNSDGNCWIMSYENGSIYSQDNYPTRTISVDYPLSDFAVRFNESEKATDGIEETGSDYAEMKSGQRVYANTTEPYGNIPVGSVGVGFDAGLQEFSEGAQKSTTIYPVVFSSNGTPITEYTIYGNTGGVGERTRNYVDRMNLDAAGLYPNQNTGTVEAALGSTYSIIIPVSNMTDCCFTINKETTAWNRCRLAGYATYPEVGTTATFVDNTIGTNTDDTSGTFLYNTVTEIPSGTNYIMVLLASGITSISSVDIFKEAAKASKPMLTTGTSKIPYVKYYSIPVICNDVTSDVSIDAPLVAGEYVTYADSNSPINTIDGQNSMTFGTTVQPSQIDFTYVGWHSKTNEIIENIIDSGAKNKFEIFDLVSLKAVNAGGTWNDNVYSFNGITYTVNDDGTITVDGTASAFSYFTLRRYSPVTDIFGGMVLSGCPSGGDFATKYALYAVKVNDTTVVSDSGDGAIIPENELLYDIRILVRASIKVSNLNFKPMICTPADWDVSHKYVPYRPSYDTISSVSPFYSVPINHNMIYRGQNLGDTLTDAQHTALSSGNFTDLFLGDYWTKSVTIPDFYELTTAEPSDWATAYTSYYTKSGDTYTPVTGDTAPTWAADTYYEKSVPTQTVTLKAVIADFDTFYAGYASGYAAINTHHAAVIVTGFNNVVWNKTNTTAGGYVNSLIHKWLVSSVLPQIESWFGSAKVLSHQKLLTNAITGDAASGWAWSSQKISLLSECQLYGMKVWGGSKATNGGYEPGEAFKHLNVFNHIDANLLFGNKNIWCRDIASAVGAARLISKGGADSYDASDAWVAPAALILLS